MNDERLCEKKATYNGRTTLGMGARGRRTGRGGHHGSEGGGARCARTCTAGSGAPPVEHSLAPARTHITRCWGRRAFIWGRRAFIATELHFSQPTPAQLARAVRRGKEEGGDMGHLHDGAVLGRAEGEARRLAGEGRYPDQTLPLVCPRPPHPPPPASPAPPHPAAQRSKGDLR
jgi:hypothetical protein